MRSWLQRRQDSDSDYLSRFQSVRRCDGETVKVRDEAEQQLLTTASSWVPCWSCSVWTGSCGCHCRDYKPCRSATNRMQPAESFPSLHTQFDTTRYDTIYYFNEHSKANISQLHHHHFIYPTIQQYAHLHRYNFRTAGQQGPTRTLTAAIVAWSTARNQKQKVEIKEKKTN